MEWVVSKTVITLLSMVIQDVLISFHYIVFPFSLANDLHSKWLSAKFINRTKCHQYLNCRFMASEASVIGSWRGLFTTEAPIVGREMLIVLSNWIRESSDGTYSLTNDRPTSEIYIHSHVRNDAVIRLKTENGETNAD